MIHITQLIYIKPGQEAVFEEFESIAIPIISKYNGKLLLRIRPSNDEIIDSTIENPYEVHLISFDSDLDFENFMNDDERKKFLHLKEQSIRYSIIIKGIEMG
ncbi:MAG: DUF1330 domain-containing protein [Ignavibacteriae bacterium]|nr:DUF1330 domain-containing protein [Ignavibacteriota bacterium]